MVMDYKNSNSLTIDEIWSHFKENPYVTILKTEDKLITQNGMRSSGDPFLRHSKAGIKVITLTDDNTPYKIWHSLQKNT